MVEQLSPLEPVYLRGTHGNLARTPGVVLSETRPGSVVQLACWRGQDAPALAAVAKATGLQLPPAPGAGAIAGHVSGFGIGPGRWLLVDQASGLADRLVPLVGPAFGAVTDLSHGRTALRVEGPRAEWVLSKLFAIDFAPHAFPETHGRATSHHDVFAQIQRTGAAAFDLYVFRSFARSFWTTLRHAAEEVGYEVR